jgi:hypothetical protein
VAEVTPTHPQFVNITNSGSGTLEWLARKNEPWLTISPTSGTAPSVLTITADPSGLEVEDPDSGSPLGEYTDTIIIGGGASNAVQTIMVTFNVGPPGSGVLRAMPIVMC